MSVPVSATLAINEALERRRRAGLPVLPLGFGEVGLPVHPALRAELAAHAGSAAYGSVTGHAALRSAAAGYWDRRGLPTDPNLVVAGPGSKPLLYSLLLGIGGDVVVPAPSWVSYAAQARLAGALPLHVPTAPEDGGIPQADLLEATVVQARRLGRDVRTVVVTVPDNPTGTVAGRAAVARFAEAARALDLLIISDEIYRDLVHDDTTEIHSPASDAPERTVVTTGLSKSLALGGWRLGVARFPDSASGRDAYTAVTGIASELWSSVAVPVQLAAAYALSEPSDVFDRVHRSRRLHAATVRAVASRLESAGIPTPKPAAAFYLYPDFQPWRDTLATRGITTGTDLATHLLDEYGMGTVPAAQFEGGDPALRLRLATSQLYGNTEDEQLAALESADPTALPWIASHLDRLSETLAMVGAADVTGMAGQLATRDPHVVTEVAISAGPSEQRATTAA